MAVTNKRVIAKTGLADRRTIESSFPESRASWSMSRPGKNSGYGTVIVRGTGGTPEVFEKIYHPLQFKAASPKPNRRRPPSELNAPSMEVRPVLSWDSRERRLIV